MKETIYWAAPLFTLAERAFNLNCAKILRNEDYMVILPQEQAEPFDMPRQALELATRTLLVYPLTTGGSSIRRAP